MVGEGSRAANGEPANMLEDLGSRGQKSSNTNTKQGKQMEKEQTLRPYVLNLPKLHHQLGIKGSNTRDRVGGSSHSHHHKPEPDEMKAIFLKYL